ncbi:amidohydrolase [Paraburkholderia dipogonis]|uniref:Amidohydrolase n=1 Tax=Paraburkholderia dipogonis TaxID=1211383 RepID=A0A4Y8MSN7_9BURK|nr:amidohydrolase [Paraburkholderia dipogonis]TFE40481.1 amidohydrolase [Paraburkholderia dipogonis]
MSKLNEAERDVVARIELYRPLCTHLSDRLWDLAETAYAEHASADLQIRELTREGFRVTHGLAGIPTAFVAEWGEHGPVIGLLGEYDALPQLSQVAGSTTRAPVVSAGNGHGCGHNLLGGAALLATLAVRDHLRDTGAAGRIRYYGCPAEEGGAGKTFMTRAGVFDDVDAVLTWHPSSIYAIEAMSTLAALHARFTFSGHAAHAAAAPHLGRSALDAVALMNVAANYLREHVPSDARLHYAIHDTGGRAPNVVQARAEVVYQIRAPELDVVHSIQARLLRIAEGAAMMTETTMRVRVEKAMSNMRPNPALSDLMYARMEALGPVPFDDDDRAFARQMQQAISNEEARASLAIFGAAHLRGELHDAILPAERMPPVLTASTDVGDVSWVVPTARCLVPCFALGTPFHSWQLVAQGKSSLAHKGMTHTAKVLAITAAALYHHPAALAAAKEALREQSGDAAYRCPIPPDVEPPVANATIAAGDARPRATFRGAFPSQYAGVQS